MYSRLRRSLAAIGVGALACLLGGVATTLLDNTGSRTLPVFLGHFLALSWFYLAPAFVTGVWDALSLWYLGKRWVGATVAVFVLAFVVSMFLQFWPYWLTYLAVAPTISAGVGLGLAVCSVGLTKPSVAVALGYALLIAAVHAVGFWFVVPLVMAPGVALPLVVACAAKRGRPDRPHGLWLGLGLLSAPVAFFAGTELGVGLTKLLS